MLKKSSVLYSVIYQKCPRCHEGNLWRTPLFPKFRLYDMYTTCPVCKINYESEPEVWYGAMIVAYIFSSVILLVTAYLAFGVFDLTSLQGYSLILAVAILGFGFNARLSRSTWINVMIHYDPDILNKQAAVKQQIAQGARVVDVRSKKEFNASHYEGAVNIPLYDLLDQLTYFKQAGTTVIVSQTGNKSGQAIEILHNNGIGQVINGGSWEALV